MLEAFGSHPEGDLHEVSFELNVPPEEWIPLIHPHDILRQSESAADSKTVEQRANHIFIDNHVCEPEA